MPTGPNCVETGICDICFEFTSKNDFFYLYVLTILFYDKHVHGVNDNLFIEIWSVDMILHFMLISVLLICNT